MTIYQNLSQTTGNTPLVALQRLAPDGGAKVAAKLEFFNPTHSVKDRIAVAMVNAAEADGSLKPGGIVIEATSGNTGIGLAFTAAARGYGCTIVMPESASIERRLLMRALGAEVLLTPASAGMSGAMEKVRELMRGDARYWYADQFNNPANPEAHRVGTGEEIWRGTAGKVDILVAGVGTGGTITGAGERLREYNPDLQVIAVEPEASAVLSGKPKGPHPIQGIGAGFIPGVLNVGLLNEVIAVKGEEAFGTARAMAVKEGLPVGISAGAAVWAALVVAGRPENKGKQIVVIVPDFAERYLSTDLLVELKEDKHA